MLSPTLSRAFALSIALPVAAAAALVGAAPATAAERETYVWAMALLPNLMATSPGQPLVQRVTYQVAQTASGSPLVTILDFPGIRNLRR